jgi:hypothetical protein
MIAGRHPTLVTEPDESLRAFKAFERAFAASADSSWDRVVGFPGGRETVNVHWHESAGIWGLFVSEPLDQERKPVGRFWIAFGVADPNQHSSLNITVEMNPPHEGENPRTAGVFLRDSWGAYTSGIQEGSEAADSSKRSSANLPRPRVSSGKRSASASLSSSVRSRSAAARRTPPLRRYSGPVQGWRLDAAAKQWALIFGAWCLPQCLHK